MTGLKASQGLTWTEIQDGARTRLSLGAGCYPGAHLGQLLFCGLGLLAAWWLSTNMEHLKSKHPRWKLVGSFSLSLTCSIIFAMFIRVQMPWFPPQGHPGDRLPPLLMGFISFQFLSLSLIFCSDSHLIGNMVQ